MSLGLRDHYASLKIVKKNKGLREAIRYDWNETKEDVVTTLMGAGKVVLVGGIVVVGLGAAAIATGVGLYILHKESRKRNAAERERESKIIDI